MLGWNGGTLVDAEGGRLYFGQLFPVSPPCVEKTDALAPSVLTVQKRGDKIAEGLKTWMRGADAPQGLSKGSETRCDSSVHSTLNRRVCRAAQHAAKGAVNAPPQAARFTCTAAGAPDPYY
jgi:hypothetical protein